MSKLKEIFTWMFNSRHPCVIVCLMILLMSGFATAIILVAAYPGLATPIMVGLLFTCAVRKYFQDHK